MDMEIADLLAEIFRRLPPRSLAASRCVCKPWRTTIDDQPRVGALAHAACLVRGDGLHDVRL
jgi:hypothetical protein